MEAHLEALLELCFYTKPPNFGEETHMKALAGDALRELGIELPCRLYEGENGTNRWIRSHLHARTKLAAPNPVPPPQMVLAKLAPPQMVVAKLAPPPPLSSHGAPLQMM
jgi:hypothetical protein